MSSNVEPGAVDHVSSYMTIRKYIDCLKGGHNNSSKDNNTVIEFGQGSTAKLVEELKGLWSPFSRKT